MTPPGPVDTSNMTPEQIAELQKQNCIFCKIISGQMDSKKVYEDDKILAILDINPATTGHTIVMPKEHYPILPLVPPEVFKHMFRATKHIAKGIKKGVPSVGVTIFVANGQIAGQQSPHFLFHIVPRDKGDGLSNFDIPKKSFPESEKIAPAIKQNLQSLIQKQFPPKTSSPQAPSNLAPKTNNQQTSSPNQERSTSQVSESKSKNEGELFSKEPKINLGESLENKKDSSDQKIDLDKISAQFTGAPADTQAKNDTVDLDKINIPGVSITSSSTNDEKEKESQEELKSKKQTDPDIIEPKNLTQHELLAIEIEDNKELKALLIQRPDKVKELIKNNPELERMFEDIDIDELSSKLKKIEELERETIEKEKKDKEPKPKKPDLDKISGLFK